MSGGSVREVVLPLRIGEYTLVRPRLRCEVHGRTVLADTARDISPGGGIAQREVDGILMRSAPLQGQVRTVHLRNGVLQYVPRKYERYYIRREGNFESYLSKFSAKTRSTLRRKVRKFAEASGGPIDFRIYALPEEMGNFHELARAVAARTYQEKLFDMGLPAERAYAEALKALAREDNVRGFLLFLRGTPVAYLCCPVVDGWLQYLYLGYLREYEKLSPGTVLLLLAIEYCFKEGRQKGFDFTEGPGGGEGGHKAAFATGKERCADVLHLKPTALNFLIVGGHWCCDRFSAAAGRVLQFLRLKSTVKKALRAMMKA